MNTGALEQASAKRAFHLLDGLRGVAAICVVMLHYGLYVRPLSIGSGYLSVDLFFGLSGFVLGYAYHLRLESTITPRRFFLLRFVRLYPLYVLGTSIAIVTPLIGLVLHLSRVWTWKSLTLSSVPALLMLPGQAQGGNWDLLYPLNFPAWSLLFEIIANVVYAALVWTRSGRLCYALVVAAGLGCIATVVGHGNIDSGPSWSGIWASFARVGFSFGMGVWIFRLYRTGALPRLRVPPIFMLIVVALLLVASPPDLVRPYYDLACIFLLFPMCIIASVINEPKTGLKLFSFLGVVSYPLYTIHLPAIYLLSRVSDHVFKTESTLYAPWIGIGMIAALIAVSFMLARYYDPWARSVLTRWLKLKAQR